jgi:hypothetical protein
MTSQFTSLSAAFQQMAKTLTMLQAQQSQKAATATVSTQTNDPPKIKEDPIEEESISPIM